MGAIGPFLVAVDGDNEITGMSLLASPKCFLKAAFGALCANFWVLTFLQKLCKDS